jgi:hypothetical protein
MLKKILLALLVIFILVQFIQPSKNQGASAANTDIMHVVKVPDSVLSILQTSCFDCHSNHTNYPWYSKITPVNWWLKSHIDEGKRKLNFSEYSSYNFKKREHKLEEVGETVEKHEMPLNSYLWIHKEAKLSDAQREMVINWTKNARKEVMQDSLSRKLN